MFKRCASGARWSFPPLASNNYAFNIFRFTTAWKIFSKTTSKKSVNLVFKVRTRICARNMEITKGAWFKFFNGDGNENLFSLYTPVVKGICCKKGCPNGG